MKWSEWSFFIGQWKYGPEIAALRERRAASQITRAQYKAEIESIKQQVLRRMVKEGRITAEEAADPAPPKDKKTRKPNIGKRVPITKAVPAHGRAHKPRTLYKLNFELPGGLPGLGK